MSLLPSPFAARLALLPSAALAWAVAVGACSSREDAAAMPTDTRPPVEDADAGLAAEVAPGLYPLVGVEPTLVADDLSRLDPIVGDAELIGIGESVHTTAGQYHLRLRILRHLIERRGLRAIAFEGAWRPIADVMEPYVTSCKGSAEEATQQLNPIWWDVSVPRFLAWLCEWNKAHADAKVHVYGFDIRQPWSDAPSFRSYITARNPSGGTAVADGLGTCIGVGYANEAAFFSDPTIREYYDSVTPVPEPAHVQCQAGVQAALADLTANRAAYVAAAGDMAWDFARLEVTQIGALDQTIFGLSRVKVLTDLQAPNNARDVAMYEAFKTLRKHRFPALKTALWAHNGHVMRRAKELKDSQWTGVQSLGTSIAEAYGGRYVVIGQSSWETSVNFPQGAAKLPNPKAGSVEAALEAYDRDYLLLALPLGTQGTPPAIPAGELQLGTDPYTLSPAKHFDALTWLRVSPGAEYFATPHGF